MNKNTTVHSANCTTITCSSNLTELLYGSPFVLDSQPSLRKCLWEYIPCPPIVANPTKPLYVSVSSGLQCLLWWPLHVCWVKSTLLAHLESLWGHPVFFLAVLNYTSSKESGSWKLLLLFTFSIILLKLGGRSSQLLSVNWFFF